MGGTGTGQDREAGSATTNSRFRTSPRLHTWCAGTQGRKVKPVNTLSIVGQLVERPRFLRKRTVLEMVGGIVDSTLWRKEQRGEFPRRIRLSARLTVWREQEVLDWMNQQGMEKSRG